MVAASLIEQAQIIGELHFNIIRHGAVLEAVHQKNLVVTSGRAALAKLLGGQTGMHVTKVGIGTNGTTPATGDTALTNPVTVTVTPRIGTNLEAEDGSTFSDVRIVQFHFLFDTSTGNGTEIAEYGLLCADGSLFSRIVRSGVFKKTNLDSIRGYWQIQF